MVRTDRHHRDALRQAARSEVVSKVRTAIAELDRTEADLLRDLFLDAFESEEGGASFCRFRRCRNRCPRSAWQRTKQPWKTRGGGTTVTPDPSGTCRTGDVVVHHIASFSMSIPAEIGSLVDAEVRRRGRALRLLDPSAGVATVHRLADRELTGLLALFGFAADDVEVVAIELGPEWSSQHPQTMVGDSGFQPFPAASIQRQPQTVVRRRPSSTVPSSLPLRRRVYWAASRDADSAAPASSATPGGTWVQIERVMVADARPSISCTTFTGTPGASISGGAVRCGGSRASAVGHRALASSRS